MNFERESFFLFSLSLFSFFLLSLPFQLFFLLFLEVSFSSSFSNSFSLSDRQKNHINSKHVCVFFLLLLLLLSFLLFVMKNLHNSIVRTQVLLVDMTCAKNDPFCLFSERRQKSSNCFRTYFFQVTIVLEQNLKNQNRTELKELE